MSQTLLCAMQVLLQIFENVLELGKVFGVGADEGLVRFEHGASLEAATVFRGESIAKRGPGILNAAGVHGEELVKAEVAEEVVVALVEIDDVKAALADLAKAEGDHGQGAHEGGVHDGTVAEIDDEFAMAAVDHFLGEVFDAGAIKEGAFPFHFDPDDLVGSAYEDG